MNASHFVTLAKFFVMIYFFDKLYATEITLKPPFSLKWKLAKVVVLLKYYLSLEASSKTPKPHR